MSESYVPNMARGLRWNDPTLAIAWPLADPILSERDAALPLFA
jgi:dTDP-4-dehydrorhamnose 3,5-epimerase